MRHALPALLAALVLTACASSGPAPVSGGASARTRTHAAPVRLDAASALARAGTADAITTAQARTMFGAPEVERRDGVGALLVWTTPGCALTLGFANDRLRTVEPGPRRTGDAAPTVQQCLAELRARTPAS